MHDGRGTLQPTQETFRLRYVLNTEFCCFFINVWWSWHITTNTGDVPFTVPSEHRILLFSHQCMMFVAHYSQHRRHSVYGTFWTQNFVVFSSMYDGRGTLQPTQETFRLRYVLNTEFCCFLINVWWSWHITANTGDIPFTVRSEHRILFFYRFVFCVKWDLCWTETLPKSLRVWDHVDYVWKCISFCDVPFRTSRIQSWGIISQDPSVVFQSTSGRGSGGMKRACDDYGIG
jgi:hypothetical protein